MPNTTSFEFGHCVLVRFPFTDQHGGKQRPAVVINTTAYSRARPDIILMAVTSQIRVKPGFGESEIEDWLSAGLLKPSAIKLIVFTAEKTIIKRILGQLNAKDQERLRAVIASVIG